VNNSTIKINRIGPNKVFQIVTCGKRSLGKSLNQGSVLFWNLASVAGLTQSGKATMTHVIQFNEWVTDE
jgi:hypothetical protein